MAVKRKDLVIPKKTSKAFELQFKENNNIVDITEWVVFFTVKENMKDSDDDAVIQKDVGYGQATAHSDPTNGITLIELSATDTDLEGNYYYDVKYKNEDGDTGILFEGRIKFTRTVTVRS